MDDLAARAPRGGVVVPSTSLGFSYAVDGDQLTALAPSRDEPSPLAVLAHEQFRAAILSSAFPCLGGAGAVRRGDYRFGVYDSLGSEAAVARCTHDLRRFVDELPVGASGVAVYVAVFEGEVFLSDVDFEHALWAQLRGLDAVERRGARPRACPAYVDEGDPGFVFAGREFFVVGLHPGASRWARRFAWPTLVFNSLSHVPPLKRSGKYDRMQGRILARDRRLHGVEYASLEASQRAQFSGRQVGPDWTCPVALEADEVEPGS